MTCLTATYKNCFTSLLHHVTNVLYLSIRVHQQKLTKSFATTSGKGVLLPPHWSEMGKENVMRVKLDTTSGLMKAEFDAVENNFRRTMAQSQIVKIDRVQNKFAWEHYTL